MSAELSDKQTKFLEALFNDADGDLVAAAEIAGYADPRTASYHLIRSLRKQIADLAEMRLTMYGSSAAKAIVDTMNNSTEMGANIKLLAAKEILDRIGVVKKEQISISGDQQIGIFILPAKDAREDHSVAPTINLLENNDNGTGTSGT